MDDKLFIGFEGDIFVVFLALISNPILLNNNGWKYNRKIEKSISFFFFNQWGISVQ